MHMTNNTFSSRKMNIRVDKLSKTVVRHLENMFFVTAITKIYPECQTDENGIKPGSKFYIADKRVAGPSKDEYLGKKIICI